MSMKVPSGRAHNERDRMTGTSLGWRLSAVVRLRTVSLQGGQLAVGSADGCRADRRDVTRRCRAALTALSGERGTRASPGTRPERTAGRRRMRRTTPRSAPTRVGRHQTKQRLEVVEAVLLHRSQFDVAELARLVVGRTGAVSCDRSSDGARNSHSPALVWRHSISLLSACRCSEPGGCIARSFDCPIMMAVVSVQSRYSTSYSYCSMDVAA